MSEQRFGKAAFPSDFMSNSRGGHSIIFCPFRGFFEIGKSILGTMVMRDEDVVILELN